MGRGSSKAGGGGGSNAKYKGFTITDQNGKKSNYIVVKGKVVDAETAGTRGGITGAMGINSNDVLQRAYDMEGSTSGLIKRVNSIGMAKAETLSDKSVKKLQAKHKKERKETVKQQEKDAYKGKKGVNRHRNYWSAM